MGDANKDCVFRTCCAHELQELTRSGWTMMESYEVGSVQPIFEPIVGHVPAGRTHVHDVQRFYGLRLESPCFHATSLGASPPEGHTVRYVTVSARQYLLKLDAASAVAALTREKEEAGKSMCRVTPAGRARYEAHLAREKK